VKQNHRSSSFCFHTNVADTRLLGVVGILPDFVYGIKAAGPPFSVYLQHIVKLNHNVTTEEL
jgi:hypothetical protein